MIRIIRMTRPAWVGLALAVGTVAAFVAATFLQSSDNGERVDDLQTQLSQAHDSSVDRQSEILEKLDAIPTAIPVPTILVEPARTAGAAGPAGAPGQPGAAGAAGEPGPVVTVTAVPRPARGGTPSAAAPSPAATVTVTATPAPDPSPSPSCAYPGVLGVFCPR